MDIAEAIDTSDPSFLDNNELLDADAIPVRDTVPTNHYLAHEVIHDKKLTFEKITIITINIVK